MTRTILYMAHPLGGDVDGNIKRALRWLSWLHRSFPDVTFVAPWIAGVLSGEDDSDPAQREAGLVDAETVVAHCHGVVLVGGRISSGMGRERGVAIDCGLDVVDMTAIGTHAPIVLHASELHGQAPAILGWPHDAHPMAGAL